MKSLAGTVLKGFIRGRFVYRPRSSCWFHRFASGKDYIVTHYRDHGHAIARGLSTSGLMAELFGRDRRSKGKGGSMHLFDAEKNFKGGHAIVGAQMPLSAGFALASQYRKEDSVTVVYFGDGATNQGTFHETMNLASVWKLPMVFFLKTTLQGHVERIRTNGKSFLNLAEGYDS